ncbi:MAG: hypothetical protein AAB116_17835 [Candidatus Poribacteria bacterium]
MKSKNLNIIFAGAWLVLVSVSSIPVARAGFFPPMILPGLGIIGPNAEVIVYEKKSDGFHIRICKENSLESKIESASGCTLAEGTYEVVMEEKAFNNFIKLGLARIDKDRLSEGERAQLELALTDPTNHNDKRSRLAELEAKLKENQDFKLEHPNDSNVWQEDALKNEIKCISDDLNSVGGIIQAKKDIDGVLTRLTQDMNGSKLITTLRHSKNGREIAFNLFKNALTNVDKCDATKTKKAKDGYVCRVGKVLWQVEGTTDSGKRVYRNLKTGVAVSNVLRGKYNLKTSGKACREDSNVKWQLPSGSDSAHDHESFLSLAIDGFLSVVPGIDGKRFLSSSFDDTKVLAFNKVLGHMEKINFSDSRYDDLSVICVGK